MTGATLAPSFFTMDEVSIVKDSVTSGLPVQRIIGEVGGPSGQPLVLNVEPNKVYVVVQDAEEEKVALATNKNKEKGSHKSILLLRHRGDSRNTQSLWKRLYC